jgi:predicted HAD superfamily phosphohydrolase
MSAGVPGPAAGGATGAGRAPRRIYVTDCEGPLTRNDNAQEIAERFLPDGAEFFTRLSKYDDFLADVIRKPGYNAGDTLRLLPPFLKAFAVSDEGVEAFSAEDVLLVPGALQALAEIAALLPTFVISTSYTPYLKALCELSGFPLSRVRCTELSLDAWFMPEDEKAWLRDEAARVMARSLIEIPDGATSADDLSPYDAATVARLDDLFWAQMHGRVSGALVAAVRPVGGGMKLAALEEIVAAEGLAAAGVMYVGDSITDAPALEAVKAWGGASLSFNGNGYALAAAEFAAASPDAEVAAELARAFAGGGRDGVEAAVRAWPKPETGEKPTGRARARVGLVAEEPEALAEASAAARRSVRGERIARLG